MTNAASRSLARPADNLPRGGEGEAIAPAISSQCRKLRELFKVNPHHLREHTRAAKLNFVALPFNPCDPQLGRIGIRLASVHLDARRAECVSGQVMGGNEKAALFDLLKNGGSGFQHRDYLANFTRTTSTA